VDESAEEAAARAMGAELLGVIGKGVLGKQCRVNCSTVDPVAC